MYSFRLMGLTFAAVTLLLGFSWTARDSFADLGLDVWDMPDYFLLLAQEEHRRASLDEKIASVDVRMRLKEILARELVAGGVSLAEAASRLRDVLGPEDSDAWQALRRLEGGGTDEERLRRHLIDIAQGHAQMLGSEEAMRRVAQLAPERQPSEVSQPAQEQDAGSCRRPVPQPRWHHHPGHRRRHGLSRTAPAQVG